MMYTLFFESARRLIEILYSQLRRSRRAAARHWERRCPRPVSVSQYPEARTIIKDTSWIKQVAQFRFTIVQNLTCVEFARVPIYLLQAPKSILHSN
jgi:hypothetical protein